MQLCDISYGMSKIDVIYNETCPICSREVAAYKRQAARAGAPVAFGGLESGAAHGLDADAAARSFHVVRDGELLEGVDAFRALWAELPRWRWLAWLVGVPGLHGLAKLGYRGFAAPLLYALHRRRVRKG